MTIEEAQAKIEELTQTNKELVERVGVLETNNKDLVEQREQLKAKIKEGANDEELKKELEAYKEQLEKVEQDKQAIESEYTQKLASMQLINQLKESGVKAHNDDALNSIASIILEKAQYKDGSFVFTDEEGKTRFNEENKPYSVIDAVSELKQSEKAYLFKEDTGAGAPTATPDTQPATDINSIIDAGLSY